MPPERIERPPDGPGLRWDLHRPSGEPRGAVFVTHGYAEHSERYAHVVEAWTARGLLVATYDLRGHGRSGGPRGHIDRFEDYLRDGLDVLGELDRDTQWAAAGPVVLFGHSLGGLISARLALAAPSRFRGLALTSPFFGLASRIPAIELLGGRAMSRIYPRLRRPSGLEGKDMTHDAELASQYDRDPLGFKHVTVRWFTETAAAQQRLLDEAAGLTLPLFCLAAGDDRVVSLDAVREVFDRAASDDKELVVLDGLFHEVLNELDRDTHIGTLADRILRWVGSAPG